MNIAICDDNKTYADSLEDVVRSFVPNAKIYVYSDGKKLLKESIKWNIVFLDIEMENIDGFKIAELIRQQYNENECIISFVTTHYEFAPDGYDYKAFRYILKTATKDIKMRKVKETIREYYMKNKFLKISYKGVQKRLPVHKILWIEAVGHCLNIRTNSEVIYWNNTISYIEDELKSYGFVRCHKSFVVSTEQIKEIRAKDVLLKNGESIPIGRAYKKYFVESFLNFKSL